MGERGIPRSSVVYGQVCLSVPWRVRVGSCYWRRHALSVYVAPLLESLDFKDRSEPLMRQLASRVDVPDQPRLHHPYVVAVADAHLQVMTVRISELLLFENDNVLDGLALDVLAGLSGSHDFAIG